jgi:hypothetical protein
MSGDPSQDYFADGVTENLTTELSRIRNSFVIACNTAFTYKGKSVDLNLHESCRIVVLLHPEWNPGVVEQQIGRVDRVNSRWAKALRQAIDGGIRGADFPRIEIRPIIFKGTYDEHNWNVLQERWDDLRAQLHGEAVPVRLRASEDAEGRAILNEIAAARPNFSPLKK